MTVIDKLFDQRRLQPQLLDQSFTQEPLGVPVGRVFRVLRRRGWIAGLVFVVVLSATAAVVMQMEPSYTAQASVLVEARRSQLNDLQVSAPEAQDTPSAVQTQIDIMRSPALMLQVVRSLALTEVPEFNPPDNGIVARLRSVLGATKAVPTQEALELTASQILAGKLVFASELRSSVVRVTAETSDAGRSAAIVNEVARHYLAFNRDRKYATLQRAVAWFQTRLTELAAQVQQSQAAVQHYRETHNLADTPISLFGTGGDRLSVQAQQLADVNRQLTEVVGERVKREAQVAAITERLQRQGRPAGMEGPVNLMAELNAIRAQEATLRQAVAQASQAVADENAAAGQMAGLLAQAQANRTMYDSFLGRATQLANAEGVQDPGAELLSPGLVPNGPSSPKRGRLLAVASGFGLLLGLGAALLADRLRSGLCNLSEAEDRLGVRALAVVPHIRVRTRGTADRAARNARSNPDFEAAMQRILGTLILTAQSGRKRVLTVTSALPQEGKSVLALGLAEAAVRQGLRVLLIDADLRRPTLVKRLRLSAQRGLGDVLVGTSRLDDVIELLPSGLHVLPSARSAAGLQQQLGSARMRDLLHTARTKFDLIVIDTPPVLPVVDALLVAQHSDAVILAAWWEHTPGSLAQEAVRLLRQASVEIVGIALTRAKLRTYANSTTEGAAYVHRHFRRYYRPAA